VLPLQFLEGEGPEQLGLDGTESYDIGGITEGLQPGCNLRVVAAREGASRTEFAVLVRLDTAVEVEYYRHGGILKYVLRQLSRS
jgi:aconitate hydratase